MHWHLPDAGFCDMCKDESMWLSYHTKISFYFAQNYKKSLASEREKCLIMSPFCLCPITRDVVHNRVCYVTAYVGYHWWTGSVYKQTFSDMSVTPQLFKRFARILERINRSNEFTGHIKRQKLFCWRERSESINWQYFWLCTHMTRIDGSLTKCQIQHYVNFDRCFI